jgi:hypothetical protein
VSLSSGQEEITVSQTTFVTHSKGSQIWIGPGNGLEASDLPRAVNERVIANALTELRSGRITGKPEIMPDCGTDLSRIAGNFRLADNTSRTEGLSPQPLFFYGRYTGYRKT